MKLANFGFFLAVAATHHKKHAKKMAAPSVVIIREPAILREYQYPQHQVHDWVSQHQDWIPQQPQMTAEKWHVVTPVREEKEFFIMPTPTPIREQPEELEIEDEIEEIQEDLEEMRAFQIDLLRNRTLTLNKKFVIDINQETKEQNENENARRYGSYPYSNYGYYGYTPAYQLASYQWPYYQPFQYQGLNFPGTTGYGYSGALSGVIPVSPLFPELQPPITGVPFPTVDPIQPLPPDQGLLPTVNPLLRNSGFLAPL